MEITQFSQVWNEFHFSQLNKCIEDNPQYSLFSGLSGSADAFLISDIYRSTKKTVLVFVESSKKAENLVDECKSFIDDESVMLFPSRDAVPYNLKSPFGPTVEMRYKVLSSLLSGNSSIIISPYTTLSQRIMPRGNLFKKIIRIQVGDQITITELSSWLVENGFKRENQVSDLGIFSIRGGILDIYPFLTENPIRIEFWGDYVESIRQFDVFTQKSHDSIKSVEIFPMREFLFTDEMIENAIDKIRSFCIETKIDEMVVHKLEHQWKSSGDHEGIEWFLHWFNPPSSSILDYLGTESIIIWDDVIPVERRLDESLQNYNRHLERAPSLFLPVLSSPEKLLFNPSDIRSSIDFYKTVFIDTIDFPDNAITYKANFSEQPQLPHQLDMLSDDFKRHYNNGFHCMLLCPNIGHAERMQELIGDECPYVEIYIGFLLKGFIDFDNKILLYSESQIFNRIVKPLKIKKQKHGVPLTNFDSLTPQDYVVHEDHGIAKFIGIERIKTSSLEQDCMVLLYADNAKVYVPVEDFHKVQKYVGKDTVEPSLSKIGSQAWEKLKTKTRESLKEMAQELIDLYAKREYLEGIRFQPDNLWQKEFEDSFIYDATQDQLKAVKEIKEDMESSKPMDRLICGDVGFGKTEVAMRAAFKAVMSGYQVAVLAPTTILAAQHYSTFVERMSDFPVKIEVLSRFLKTKEQKIVLEKLLNAKCDILIGTHRILSEDVKFKNLGLLIVDEEQRFGVNHKERLKQLRYSVDVLSMTATPIPRTLHMSLIGTRDLSIINTPPRNRLPVETKVAEYHDEIVRNAVDNEIDRGGQVFFVNNRISNLEQLKDKIEQLVPRARVVTAHGQMDEKELEMIMKEFIAGRFDVMISTVIIENGLDIPNVNTIIINRADALGLSQLYQLRGRVGRSSEQAFAYFLTPINGSISEVSLKRLRALEQYTDLGSGFQIAMRDLEIRGAGNILGTSQHGFIAAVGFELYCRLLEDALKEIKGEKVVRNLNDVKIEIPIEAFIPSEYINDGATRIATYQELSSIRTIESIGEIEKDISDRFGPLPKTVNSLLLLMRIKIYASLIECIRVSISKEDKLVLYFDNEKDSFKDSLKQIFNNSKREFEIAYEIPINIKTSLVTKKSEDQVMEVLGILSEISTGCKEKDD
jgi:transcription-repair coupling factor (superfamily II helicase)